MTIAEARVRSKALGARVRALAGRIPRDALVLAVLMAASVGSFGLGYLSGRDAGGAASPVAIEAAPEASTPAAQGQGSGAYLASKNGSKYYLATCSGAKRISDANKVWFATAAAAVAAGYAPAANCAGL